MAVRAQFEGSNECVALPRQLFESSFYAVPVSFGALTVGQSGCLCHIDQCLCHHRDWIFGELLQVRPSRTGWEGRRTRSWFEANDHREWGIVSLKQSCRMWCRYVERQLQVHGLWGD